MTPHGLLQTVLIVRERPHRMDEESLDVGGPEVKPPRRRRWGHGAWAITMRSIFRDIAYRVFGFRSARAGYPACPPHGCSEKAALLLALQLRMGSKKSEGSG